MAGLAAWAEEDHPRDESGKFTSGGAPKSEKKEKPVRQWTDERPEHMPAETWQAHYDKHPDQGGQASKERREQVHDPIIRDALDSVKAPAKGEPKIAIMTMGGPASGKSSMLRGIDSSKFVKVDPDAIKEKLPEYQEATRPEHSFRGAAAMVHEESSHIAKQIMKQAVDQGKHVIVDGTGANPKSMIEKMKALRAAGYTIHVAMPHLDVEEGVKRMKDRAEKTGRYVPEEFARHAYEVIPRNFGAIAAHADSFDVFDASPSMAEGGAKKVWSSAGQGSETHHDPAFVASFRSKYGGVRRP